MATIYLHVGPHKTATSSIQEGLRRYREELGLLGIYFPLLPGPDDELYENHSLLMHSLFGAEPEGYHINVARGFTTKEAVVALNHHYRDTLINEAHKCANNYSAIVFSGEDMVLLSDSEIRQLREFLLCHFGRTSAIKIVFYVRAPNDWFSSLVQQWVRGGEVLDDIIDTKFFDIKAKLQPFCRHFGKDNVLIGKYEDAIHHQGGPVAHFLSLVFDGIDTSNIRSSFLNVGLCAEAVQLISALNKASREAGEGLPVGVAPEYLNRFSQIRGAKFVLPKDVQKRVWADALESLEWIQSTFGIDLYKGFEYFEPRKPMWSEDALLSIAKLVWENRH
jgi:hypothetical protein